MRHVAVAIALMLLMFPLLPLIGSEVRDAQAGSVSSGTKVFHLHDGPDYLNANVYDWMNSTGPANPANPDYDMDGLDGVSIKKNVPPQRVHHWVLYPDVDSNITISGDMTSHLWARSRGNLSGTLITAIFYDMAPGDYADPSLWTEICRNTVPLSGDVYSDFKPYDVNATIPTTYTLLKNHSLVLTVMRGDSLNDWLIIMFDQTAKDSYVSMSASTFVSVDSVWSQDDSGNNRTVFSDLESIKIEANISDPYGSYDIAHVNASVAYSSNGSYVLSPTGMDLIQSDPSSPPYWNRFELTLSALQTGSFTVNVTASDPEGTRSWLTTPLLIVTVDHFFVSAPPRATAGTNFSMTIAAKDPSNATITNWVGPVQLVAFRPDKSTPANGTLANSSVFFSIADAGQLIVVDQRYDRGEERVFVKAISGSRIGWSTGTYVASGPVDNVTLAPPGPLTRASGQATSLVALGVDFLKNTNTSWTPYWSVLGGIGYIQGSGISVIFVPTEAGHGFVNCKDNLSGASDSVEITVSFGNLVGIEIISPVGDLVIQENKMKLIIARGYDSFNNTVNLSGAHWGSTVPGGIEASIWGDSAVFTSGFIPGSGQIRVQKASVVGVLNVTIITSDDGPWFNPIPDQSVMEDSGSWILDLDGYWNSKDGTYSLTWWVANVDTNLYLISHDTVSNAIIHFYPQPNAHGSSNFTLWAMNPAGYQAKIVVFVTITAVNHPPQFVNDPPSTLYVKFDTPYLFDFTYYVRDVDNPKSGLSMTSSVNNVYFDRLLATFMFPKKPGQESYFEFVKLTLTDGSASTDRNIVVWVTSDTPPSLREGLPNQTLMEHDTIVAFDLDDYFFDIDNETLFYTFGFKNVHVNIDSITHLVTMSAPGEWSGMEEGVFTAVDKTGALKADTVNVTVLPVNDAPQLLMPIGTIFVKYNTTYYLYLSSIIFDPDNSMDSLTFNISDTHVKHTVSSSGAHRLELTFPRDMSTPVYTVAVEMRVSDPGNLSVTDSFYVRVTEHEPPTIKAMNPDQLYFTFPENAYLNGSLQLYNLFKDNEGLGLSFYIYGPTHVFAKQYADGVVNLTSTVNWSGAETFNIRAMDPYGGWSFLQVHVTVTPVNQAPVISQIPNLINRGSGFRTAHYPISQYVTDSDNSYSELTYVVSPVENAFVIGEDLYVSLPDGVDVITVTIQANDGQLLSNTVSFKVGTEKTMAEKMGWPYSFPLVLLAVGVAAYFGASRIPRPYKLESLFLIHNDGRLISHATKEENTSLDKDVVSAMFTAVQEFVRDSFQKGEIGLKKLEIGDKNVVIEKGQFVYLALIYSGWPAKDTFSMLPMVLRDIEERYKDRIERWNGTMKTVGGVDRMLQEYMSGSFKPGMWHEEEELAEMEWVDILSKES